MSITCPGCKGQIEISDDLYGEALECPHCTHLFQLTKKGKVTKYVAPSAGGRSNKPMIIGVTLAVICVIAGIGFLVSSSAKRTSPSAAGAPAAVAPAASAPEPDSSGGSGMDSDTDTMATLMGGGENAGPASPNMEPLPPVEIPDTPDGMVLAVANALADGNPRGVWDAMPASYQTDLNDLVHQASGMTDPVAWDKGFAIASRLTGVLRDKKEFVFGNPMVAMNPKVGEIEPAWDGIVSLLTTVTESDLAQLDNLKTLDVGDFLGTTGVRFIADIESLAKLAPSNISMGNDLEALRSMTATVLNTTDGVAELEVKIPAVTNFTEKFVQVEGRWVPQEIATDWEKQMKIARGDIEKATKAKQQTSMQAMAMMGMVEGVLATFENANSQVEFDQALQGAFGMFMQMSGAGQGGPGAGGPGAGGPGMGRPGMDGSGMGGGDMGGPGMQGGPPRPGSSKRPPRKKGMQPPAKKGMQPGQ
jgi:hypothetical protein